MKIVRRIIEQEIIDKMLLIIKVTSVNALVLNVCRTGWLRVGSVIKDDNEVEYRVESFVFNQSVTLDKLGFVGNIHISKPKLIDATIKQGLEEFKNLSNLTSEKTPIIYLQDGSVVDAKNNRNSIEATITGSIFFIDWYNDAWQNDKINSYVLEPINELSEHFKNTTEENFTFFKNVESYLKTERKRFGREDQNGLISHYFGESLTAIEVRFSINANRTTQSCCDYLDSTTPPTCAPASYTLVNTGGDNLGSGTIASGGSEEIELPDTQYIVNYGGSQTSFFVPTLANKTINFNFI